MREITDIVMKTLSGDITMVSSLVSLGAALVLGLMISATYMLTHKDRYQSSLAVTLTMLPAILAVIILFVGSNVARAFSLAGTLSIIRFRSAPGEPIDIGYIFFDIAAGLACGVGLWLYGLAFVIMLCLFLLFLNKINYAGHKTQAKILKIIIPEDLDYQGIFDEILEKYTKSSSLIRVKTTDLGSLYELVYHVTMTKNADEKQFIDELRCRNGNLSITLSMAQTEL